MKAEQIIISNGKAKGFILVLIAATLWGVSGTVAQFLFQQQGFSTEWLVVIRLLISGVLLLLFASLKEKQNIWAIWKVKRDVFRLLMFSTLGLLAVQYTYFVAIDHSNAATATILQYLAPVIITCFVAVQLKKMPTSKEILAVFLALFGTFMLVTRGDVHSLSISGSALFWGLSSSVALAFYTLQPIKLLEKWGSTLIVGWGMLIGGIAFSFIHPPWHFEGQWTFQSYLAVVFIVIFGTLIAFYCFLDSLKYISASEASLLSCVEPLSAVVLSTLWLHVSFGLEEWIGTISIILTMAILSKTKKVN